MMHYSDIIEYENENSRLDFKKSQYRKENHQDFIKDVMSLANANVEGHRHIVIGVYFENGERLFHNTPKEEVHDPAIYQQIIHQNVEPDIDFDYFVFEHMSINFPIFVIKNCKNKPYMMRKDFGTLKKGDSWIRKGTHQPRMLRSDFDRFYEEKFQEKNFQGDLKVLFTDSDSEEIVLPKTRFTLKSERMKNKIKQLIEQKKKISSNDIGQSINPLSAALVTASLLEGYGIYRKYENMSVKDLEEELKDIEEKFLKHDLYEFYEVNSSKINVIIENTGERYIEDATVQLIFDKIRGVDIADEIYEEPADSFFTLTHIHPIKVPMYPMVIKADSKVIVEENIRNIKHKIPIIAFEEPIRITITEDVEIDTIPVICKVFGKNLADPVEKKLLIRIIENDSQPDG